VSVHKQKTWTIRRCYVCLLLALLMGLTGCDGLSTGDRVLVAKCMYDTGIERPKRFDVVVFKFPQQPTKKGSPHNYIKRLLGLPGQILAIFFGQLFCWNPPEGAPPFFPDVNDPNIDPNQLWTAPFMHADDERSRNLFNEPGKFQIVRKPPDVMMAMRRIVYDNNFPADDMKDYPRWAPQPGHKRGWDAQNGSREFSHSGAKNDDIDWLVYQHLLRPEHPLRPGEEISPGLITDFVGYNAITVSSRGNQTPPPNWAGDLMLECNVTVVKPEGTFFLELTKGVDRFRTRWDLESGVCTLLRRDPASRDKDSWKEVASQPTALKKAGTYQLRFANFDARLTVWVDRALPFQDGWDYDPPEIRSEKEAMLTDEDLQRRRGPTRDDLQPARIGSRGAAVRVANIRLWRDTYYTCHGESSDHGDQFISWTDPRTWDALRKQPYRTMYVQPGHYLCLGDNSPASLDSRSWGLVPERLLLGRALLVYFPPTRAGLIR
jgi:signal peptidase I